MTFGVGACAALGVGALLEHLRTQSAAQTMDRQTALAQQAVRAETTRYVDAVRDVAAGVGAQADLNDDDFQDITAPLADQHLSGASAVVLIVPVRPAERGRVQAFWRARGADGLVLRPGAPEPDVHYYSILERNLDGGGRRGTGTDVRQAAEPSAALAEAQRSDGPVVSDTYLLLRDRSRPRDQQQHSFVIVAPVYSPAAAVRGGVRPFRGWIVMGLRGQDFIAHTLRDTVQDLQRADLVATSAEGQVTVASLGSGASADLARSATIPVAGKHWILRTRAESTALPGGGRTLTLATVAAGLAIAVLLGLLTFLLLSSRARALRQVAAATDELRAQERAARDQANLLSVIMDSLSEAVVVVDPEGALLHQNRSATALAAQTEGGPGGRWFDRLAAQHLDGSLLAGTDRPWTRAARRGEHVDGEEMMVGPTASEEAVILSVNARPLHGQTARRGAVAVLRDITAHKQQEAQLAVAAALLEQELAQRRETEVTLIAQTEELNAYAGVVAHDLKAPLSAVAGYAELLECDLASLPGGAREHRASIDAILKGTERMRRLIDDLLSYASARDAKLDPADIDLNQLVDEVVTEWTAHLPAARGPAPPGPVIRVRGALDTIRADAVMVRRLFDNLVGNALKYTAAGHRAEVEISSAPDGDGHIEVTVADRGIGVPPEQRAKVFDSFHRAHRDGRYQGTGLGLAICQRVVLKHGGHIFVDENPGGGSRFRFTLPAPDAHSGGGRHGQS
ncbi:ATP-binding protein [Pilimelia terevasa]|uniref:ATP-binding protein n=1 Tax=Pilimelia terevasa TaxID=53372 RepID=UPI00166E5C30|nr:ATP-binding protein [Pilimelia terevasa]